MKRYLLLLLIMIGMWTLVPPRASDHAPSAAGTPHKVHIAFGMHVNLYHSFRGDTNDENGFGQDIRVIRHTLRELERLNKEGIPVKAVWDFDNLFSLQEILPAHAPDIIRDVQRRVRENKDDVILMSYNNGLMSAMNDEEFMTSMQRAISNNKGSGVQDLFGRFAPVVRPQEMMTTPGHFERYRKLGIAYAALYYSATPFDAFRVFSRALTPTEAHNPVEYRNPASGERIVVIPTYHAGDLVEHVSLRNWAEQLHRLQTEGKIDRDVLIFINFDADAEFWTGADLPWNLKWLPNTGGIGQLVDSVADLDFVSFSNLTDYLATHPPTGTIHFSQDTADGSFNGYQSWAEKAYVSDYWSRVVRNRRAHRMAQEVIAADGAKTMPPQLAELLQQSFEIRLRVLSTTNFGLATPFLARQREAAMATLLDRLDGYTDRIRHQVVARARTLLEQTAPSVAEVLDEQRLLDTFLLLEADTAGARPGDRSLEFTLPDEPSGGKRYLFADTQGRIIPATVAQKRRSADGQSIRLTLRVSKNQRMPKGIYFLLVQPDDGEAAATADRTVFADTHGLRNEFIDVQVDDHGHVSGVTQNGVVQLDAGSLVPYIIYQGRRWQPARLTATVEEAGRDGVAVLRLHGVWNGPPGNTRAPGWVDYRLRLVRGIAYLFIEGDIRYPDTYRHQVLQAQKPMLARKIDAGWEAVAPVELRFSAFARKDRPFSIHKRNYLGKEDAYALDYYRHSPQNLNLAAINNHITAEYAAVTSGARGLAVAANTQVNANFAFCPFKMNYLPSTDEFAIRANPFGTYHGDQIVPPTRGNRLGYEAVLLSAPQLHSAAPTYNGYRDRFELMVSFFKGDGIPEAVKQDLIAFASRPLALGARQGEAPRGDPAALLPPAGFMALPDGNGMLFHWETAGPAGTAYRVRYRALAGSAEKSFTATGGTYRVDASDFSHNDDYAATIQAVYPDGRISDPAPEIRFRPAYRIDHAPAIPTDFKAKIIWANLNAWIWRNLL